MKIAIVRSTFSALAAIIAGLTLVTAVICS